MEIPKQPRLLVKQKVALYNQTVGPHCQGQHPHNSLKMEMSVVLVPTRSPHSYILVSLVREGTLQATEREMWTPSQPQNL